MSTEFITLANHPIVLMHLSTYASRYKFCDYYLHKQAQSPELLSLLQVIEYYRCAPIAELVAEMAALYSVEV